MRIETMTPLERWTAVLNHQIPDRIPIDFWGTSEITNQLMNFLECENRLDLAKKIKLDLPYSPSPAYIGPTLPAQTDIFGIQYRSVNYGAGTYDESANAPLAQYTSVEEIKASYTFPSVDWLDYSNIAAQCIGWEDYPLRAGGSEPMLTYKQLRGEEQAMIDLAQNPEIAHYCLDQLFNFAYQTTLRLYENLPKHLKPLYSYVAEDLGGQRNLMYSPRHIKEFLFPGMRKMIELAHSAGAKAFHHDDGNVTKILPDLVDLGIDILNPIQWRADGMDRQMLKDTFGSRLVFHGAVDNQYTLPFGTTDEVRQEVIDNINILGKDGGYILAPCHNIQPNTSIENIITMYETALEYGFYN